MLYSKTEISMFIFIGLIAGIFIVKIVDEINYSITRKYTYRIESYGQSWITNQVPVFSSDENGEQKGSNFTFTTTNGEKVVVSGFEIKRIK